MQIIISTDGTLHCIYSDTFALSSLGRLVITRASHVEPDADGNWHADLSPVSGPKLGPFRQRRQALVAELRWLERHWLQFPMKQPSQ